MVPFRLTQNIVDSFGLSGVEGTFRKCAEITLQVRASVRVGVGMGVGACVRVCSCAWHGGRTHNVMHTCARTHTCTRTHCTHACTRAQVLRQHRATLMTSAETFLYDPLVDWMKKGVPDAGVAAEQENPSVGEKRLAGAHILVLDIVV